MSTMVSNLELIRRVPLFSMLTASQAEAVAAAVIKRRYKRGEAIVERAMVEWLHQVFGRLVQLRQEVTGVSNATQPFCPRLRHKAKAAPGPRNSAICTQALSVHNVR